MKPCLRRSSTCPGIHGRTASLRRRLPVPRETFADSGRLAAISMKAWSRSGERTSSEWAMLAMSIFTSSWSGRYVCASTSISRSINVRASDVSYASRIIVSGRLAAT